MWYRESQRGVMNYDRLFQGAEQAIINWLQDQIVLVKPKPGESYDPQGYVDLTNINIPPYLKKYISSVDHNIQNDNSNGEFNSITKTLSLPSRIPYSKYKNLISTVLHEVRHAIDPRNENRELLLRYKQQYTNPNKILGIIKRILNSTGEIPSYDEVITQILRDSNSDPNFEFARNLTKKNFTEAEYKIALDAKLKNRDLYLNNPMEHSSQLGDIRRLLRKENLDKVREFIRKNNKINLSDDQLRLLIKNGLNPKSPSFEAFSQVIQQVSGNTSRSISNIVKNIENPNWQKQYLKLVSDAVSVYDTDGNRFKGLVRKENLIQPGVKSNPNFNLEDSAKGIQNRASFFSKAAELEKLAETNPRLWNRFIKLPMMSRMIPKNASGIFKSIGTGSKSLSQSLKGLNLKSPLWALLEPALEFGLYQFGLYLENPSSYASNFITIEQRLIRELNSKIDEIIADPKITDKRGYFIENYGSYLKTLGNMEQNELLSKFSVMSFNNFMNIGNNIRQK